MVTKKKPEQFLDFCPVGYAIDFISKKWAMYVIRELKERPKRFNEIYNALSWGISPKTLAQRLKELQREKIIEKQNAAYALTAEGKELADALTPIERWARKNVKKIFSAKEKM